MAKSGVATRSRTGIWLQWWTDRFIRTGGGQCGKGQLTVLPGGTGIPAGSRPGRALTRGSTGTGGGGWCRPVRSGRSGNGMRWPRMSRRRRMRTRGGRAWTRRTWRSGWMRDGWPRCTPRPRRSPRMRWRARERTDRIGLTAAMGAVAAAGGRRGPGMPGSAKMYPGEYVSRASGFAGGMPLDTAPGCLTLGQFAEEAAGEDDSCAGASDDELAGCDLRVGPGAGARRGAQACGGGGVPPPPGGGGVCADRGGADAGGVG